jgi:hypothetical protein
MNEYFVILAAITAGLREMSKDPELGEKGEALSSILDVLTLVMTTPQPSLAALAELRDSLAVMNAESREPTREEWVSLRDRARRAHALIQGE